MAEDEFEWVSDTTWFVLDQFKHEASRRCAEMVFKALRADNKAVANHYLHAAQWFALAAEREERDV